MFNTREVTAAHFGRCIHIAPTVRVLLAAALSLVVMCGRRTDAPPMQPFHGEFLVVVNAGIEAPLQLSLDQYAATLALRGINVHVEAWGPGTVQELRALLFDYIDHVGIDGALLVGDLPVAWYEQFAFGSYEQFPTDLYLQDRDALWRDQDANGRFELHSELELDIFTARLIGTPAQLQDYFARVEYYRVVGQLVDTSAFVFVDNDWAAVPTTGVRELRELYADVDVCRELAESTMGAYFDKLSGGGAEFVYQFIHSGPDFLIFEELDELGESFPVIVVSDDIARHNCAGTFYNLNNCSAARFTERASTLAETYTVGTDHGLAIIGSTKTGAVRDATLFHGSLASGSSWGEAYRHWYNHVAQRDDEWHLGIVIMGDPLLTIEGEPVMPRPMSSAAWASAADADAIMELIAAESVLGTFEEYQARHPEFFSD
jgi:hypothetical protein